MRKQLNAEGFIEFATQEIATARKNGDTKRIGEISRIVAEVSKAHEEGNESIVVKGFEGAEEIEILTAARAADGSPRLIEPNDERSASGQGIASNLEVLGKQAKDLKKNEDGEKEKSEKGDDDKNEDDKNEDDSWPDDLASPDAKGPTWGKDPE